MELTIARHCVQSDSQTGLSELQSALINHSAPVRIASAPTGAGKSYAFLRAIKDHNHRVFFLVPTKRLAQNLAQGTIDTLVEMGWSRKLAAKKVVIWSGDETQRLRTTGVDQITSHRLREIASLDDLDDQGEIIYAIPEVLSWLLLRPYPAQGVSSKSILDLLNDFDHIVFDEFHTIESRGFGLGVLCSVLAARLKENFRAKVSFLSATPLNLMPVLKSIGLREEDSVFLEEPVGEEGRTIHGDVRLEFITKNSLIGLLESKENEVREFLEENRQIIVIYDGLDNLKLQQERLFRFVQKLQINPQRVLIINSIDDSSQAGRTRHGFSSGRFQDPDQHDIIVSTSSVEMGVTFRSGDMLVMEAGFEPMNFLQRYGRCARRGNNGLVTVRIEEGRQDKNWKNRLIQWADEHQNQICQISELTEVLSQSVRRQHSNTRPGDPQDFGDFPRRSAFAAGLYWKAVMDHWSMKGPRRQWLWDNQPPPSKAVAKWLKQLEKLSENSHYQHSAPQWIKGFQAQAYTLRNMGSSVRVIEANGNSKNVSELWLHRNTDIPKFFEIEVDSDEKRFCRILEGELEDYLLEEKNFVDHPISALMPHTQEPLILDPRRSPIETWVNLMKQERNTSNGRWAWQDYPDSMEAAIQLVRTTGLIVTEEEDEFALGTLHRVL